MADVAVMAVEVGNNIMPLTATKYVVQLNDVHKTYYMGSETVHAMAGVTLDFEDGVFCAIMGSSGSGKSTMLNILGCLDRPTKGSYHLVGEEVAHLDDDRLSDIRLKYLGFIFQSFNLISQLTVRENIEMPLFYLGWGPAESKERAAELANMVGLGDRLGHRPSELSGGQMQRVAIARALANDPTLLLADEPTGNLDTKTGDQIMDMLHDLNAKGKTIIMVTHEPEVAAHASMQVHMRDGIIESVEHT